MSLFAFNVTENIDITSGTKAEELCRLKSLGVNVPRFWAVNHEEYERFISVFSITPIGEFLKQDKYDDSERKKIATIKKELMANFELEESETRLIARSSSIPTKKINNYASMISGAFESYECDCNSLAESIAEVYESMYSENAFLQLKLAKLEDGVKGMGILIQEYIEPECSGVLHVYTDKPYWEINWVKGHLRAIVSGDTSGDYDRLYEKNGDIILKGRESHIYCVMENDYYQAFTELYHVAKLILMKTKTNLEIEWIYKNDKIYIVQCQELIDI